jgi:hypothetical protein
MPDLTVEQVDRLMLALDNLDAYLEGLDTARKPRTKVVYRDPPDPKAVDLSQLADSIHRRLTLLEADAAQGAAPRAKGPAWECGASEAGGYVCSRPMGHKGMHRRRLRGDRWDAAQIIHIQGQGGKVHIGLGERCEDNVREAIQSAALGLFPEADDE